LLKRCASTLNHAAGAQVDVARTNQSDDVDAEMAVEPSVFGREDRLGQPWRHLAQLDHAAIEIAVCRKHLAVARDEGKARPPVELVDAAQVRKSEGEIRDHHARGNRAPDRQNGAPFQERAEQTAARPLAPPTPGRWRGGPAFALQSRGLRSATAQRWLHPSAGVFS
jgi:hypothetical protein